ncbi:uncharacterized protein F4807DRAFT_406977 [Annulohypoxylon truncatum]|uniref:uncharacterized protein n=1 Tax=Annulohypoxylon truncatum TaxID=327061 RepID=UPI002007F263|nr:uncharacterized protein F4807DRAFT_406977 [Annulohypoxylon truncatum]KAI1214164.1 hypothetical protein F4807DRAFT_406977 [Annulohypoxylon truncatum]
MLETSISIATRIQGSITVYKGMDKGRADRLFDDAGNVHDITSLNSDPPSDFINTMTGLGIYFTVCQELAVKYACYIKHRDNVIAVVVVRATIPNSAIESLSSAQLQKIFWPSYKWKSLIYHSRRGLKLPSDLGRSLRDAILIIGTISTRPKRVYDRMDGPEEVTEDHLLRDKNGNPAIQYVFRGESGGEFFMQHIMRSMTVHAMTTREYISWYQNRSAYPIHNESLPEAPFANMGESANRP